MEWSKTKTILIIALVITNLIIGYFVWQDKQMNRRPNAAEREADMIAILKDNHIDASALKSIQQTTMPELYASFHVFQLDQLAQKLLKPDYVKYADAYRDSDYELVLKDKQTMLMSTRRPLLKSTSVIVTPDQIEDHVENWLLDKFGATRDFKCLNRVETPAGLLLNYGQFYGDYFIDGSYMSILMTDMRITRLERKWFDIQVKEGEMIEIAPYAIALYRLMDQVYSAEDTSGGAVMEEVSLGYRLEGNVFNTDIMAGEVSPYFKFKSKIGRTYLVEALWSQ